MSFMKKIKLEVRKHEKLRNWIHASRWIRRILNYLVPTLDFLVKMPRGFFLFKKDMKAYNKMLENSLTPSKRFKIESWALWPRYTDRWLSNGSSINQTYFFATTYIAQQIIDNKPVRHFDIGSSIESFISKLMAARINTTIIDIRPFPHKLKGVSYLQGNATCLDTIQSGSIESLSSIYAVEHYGLGRYGDPIDPDGWYKGMTEKERVLKSGGGTIFSDTNREERFIALQCA